MDYVLPLLYCYFNLDTDMPIDWIIEEAHRHDVSVYGMLEPYVRDEYTGSPRRIFPSAETMRAAIANNWDRGVDGMYTWFMSWPLEDTERRILSEMANPEIIAEKTKRYVLRERFKETPKWADYPFLYDENGYNCVLPLRIPGADKNKRYAIPFYIADDTDGKKDRISRIVLKLTIDNLLSEDRLTILLNGESLAGETCMRYYGLDIGPYDGQKLEFHLNNVRPRRGENTLEISLDERPELMGEGINIHDVEIFVEYSPYPSCRGNS